MKSVLCISRQTARDGSFAVLLSIYFVASMTWAFKADYTLLAFEFAFRFLLPIVLVLLYTKIVPPAKAQVLVAIYVAVIGYMFAVAAASEAPVDVIVNTAKFLYPLMFFVALVLILHPRNFSVRVLYVIPLLGLLGAVQTLTLAALIYTGHAPPMNDVVLVGYKNFAVPSFGIFGYAWGSIALGTPYQVYRAQSFFGEPTRMASFMEVATVLSWGLYKVYRKRWCLVAAILGFITVVACFSMAADVVALLVLGFYFAVTQWRRLGHAAPAVASVVAVIIVAAVLGYLGWATTFYSQANSTANLAFGHADTEVEYRVQFVVDSLRLVRDHPFGIGVIGMEDSRILKEYPGAGGLIAPLEWLTKGGILGLLLQFVIMFYAFKTTVIRQLQSVGIQRYIALAFVLFLFHQCVAGDWMDAMFLFLLAAVVMYDRYSFGVPGAEVTHSHVAVAETQLGAAGA